MNIESILTAIGWFKKIEPAIDKLKALIASGAIKSVVDAQKVIVQKMVADAKAQFGAENALIKSVVDQIKSIIDAA